MDKTKIKALSRYYNKKWLKGYKADFLLGSYEKTDISVKEFECIKCKIKLFFADTVEEHPDLMKKKIKYICAKCLLELDEKEHILNSEQYEMVLRYLNDNFLI